MDKLDIQIQELEKKIAVEKKVKTGAESMKSMLKDKNAMGQVEISIAESQKRLDFLQGEMQKLVLKKGGFPDTVLPTPLTQPSNVPNRNSPDPFIKQKSKSSSIFGKVFSSISLSNNTSNQPATTIDPPTNLERSESANSLKKNTAMDLSKTSNSLTAEKVAFKVQNLTTKLESQQKIKSGIDTLLQVVNSKSVLNSSEKKNKQELVKKMQDINSKIKLLQTALVRYQAMFVEGLANLDDIDNDSASKTLTANLKVGIIAVQNLFGKKTSKNDAYVVVRIDDVIQGRTKSKSKLLWDETLELSLLKASEIEFTVYDKNDGLLAIAFFRLGDLEAEITSLAKEQNGDEEHAVENVYELEPNGEIQLRFNFYSRKNKHAQGDRLQRGANVRKRKFFMANGHRFVPEQFYSVTKCAFCSEFLMTGTGYQCESCDYLCHKKCYEGVLLKCITRSRDASEINAEQSKKLKHNVPHRFDHASSMVPQWCCHCGLMLPIGVRKTFEKCNECSACVHSECKLYVPNLCGMTMETANKILAATQEVEKMRKEAAIKQAKELANQQKLQKEKELAEKQQIERSIQRSLIEELNRNIIPSSNNEEPTAPKGDVRKSGDRLAEYIDQQIPPPRKTTLEDFHFIAVLGKGNFGKVMLSEDKATKQLWAIKVLKKDFIIQNDEVESTRSEKRVFCAINRERHPFLVGLHSCFQSESRIYFVMEYISGGDLMLHIQRQQFSEKRAKFYAVEVLMALEHFHKNDIVYRDLKLDNILLTLDGHVKVADYGLCKENMFYGSTTNTFCGTPEFMAPEILMEQDYGRAVDWWALGVLIYEMLLGQAPFKGNDEDEIFDAIIREEPIYPSTMQRDAISICQQLLCKDPLRRLGSSMMDAEDIKKHPYFNGVNWEDMYYKRIPPPFIPQIRHAKDVSNFDEEFTRELPVLTPIDNTLLEEDQEQFKNFTYTADWVLDPTKPVEYPKPNPSSVTPLNNNRAVNGSSSINNIVDSYGGRSSHSLNQ